MRKNVISYLRVNKLLEENVTNKINLKIKIMIALASFLAVVIGVYQMGTTNSVNLDSIIIEVNYANPWNATITINGSPHVYMHRGHYTIVFSKLNAEYWDISGVFFKEDNSADRFSVLIRHLNGSILLNSMTSEPYAIIKCNVGFSRGNSSEFIGENYGIREFFLTPSERARDLIYCYGPIEFEQLHDKAHMNLLP